MRKEPNIHKNNIIIKNSDFKFFEHARQMAELSDFRRVHIGCVAVYGNKIIASGFNSNRTHPLQAKLNRFRSIEISNHTIHAEISCLSHIWNANLSWNKVKLYIYRTRCDGRKGMSRPCPACMAAIKQLGIKEIFYTTMDGVAHEIIS